MRHFGVRKLVVAMLAFGMIVSTAGMTQVQAAWDITAGGGSGSRQETTAAETEAQSPSQGSGKTSSAYDWLTEGTSKPTTAASEEPTTAAPAQTEPAQTEAVETEAAETEAMETEAPETEAMETEAAQTEAMETEAMAAEEPPLSEEELLAIEAEAALVSYLEQKTSLEGHSYYGYLDAEGGSEFVPYGYDISEVPSGVLGSTIRDLDGDGMPELLTASMTVGGLVLTVEEYASGLIVTGARTTLPDVSYRQSLNAGGHDFTGLIDVFLFGEEGNTIAVEEEELASLFADGRYIGLTTLTYDGSALTKGPEFTFAGSVIEPGSTAGDDLAKTGIAADIDQVFESEKWIADFAENKSEVARVTTTALVPFADYQDWAAKENTGRLIWTRIHVANPGELDKARIDLDLSEKEMTDLNMLFRGFIPADEEEMNGNVSGWSDDVLLASLYSMLNQDYSAAEGEEWGVDPTWSLENYDIYSEEVLKDDALYRQYALTDILTLIKSVWGRLPAGMTSEKLQSVLFSDAKNTYVMRSDGPQIERTIDSVFEAAGRLFAEGTSIEYTYEGVFCQGRFLAELVENPDSIFSGYSLKTIYPVIPSTTIKGLTAEASSFVPADTASYGPDMAVDGRVDTAWNEDAEGVGIGEWIEIHTPNDEVMPITGLHILDGYQKSEELFASNGRPTKVSIELSDGTVMEANLWYDDYILLGKVAEANWVKVTILEAEAGADWEDVCITEIELLTTGTSDEITAEEQTVIDEMLSAVPEKAPEETTPAETTPAETTPAETTAPLAPVISEYILPDSSTRVLSADELYGLTAEQLRIARNEIYARHGRRFNSADLQAWFDSKSWYTGTIAPEAFDQNILSSIELLNLDLIQKVENGTVVPQPPVNPENIMIPILGGYTAPASDFMYPYSSSQLLTQADLDKMWSTDQTAMHNASQMAINEIFARYGFPFGTGSDTATQAYQKFTPLAWYQSVSAICPSLDWYDLLINFMNDYERANIEAINNWQKANGVYY